VWAVAPIAVLKVVAPAIDGPNRFLVIRFEHEGQERFARSIGETDWREQSTLEHLFEAPTPATTPAWGRLRRPLFNYG